jgi:DNA-binding SARP family transcriptional activator
MMRIWLFGSMSIATSAGPHDATPDGIEAVAIAGRCANLLAYLALGHGRYFSRSELLDSLWPEQGTAHHTGSFNTALWRLRRMIERPPLKPGDLITADRRGAIGLNGPAGIWLDVDEFERMIAPGLSKPLERLSDADIDDLNRGVALYKSDILLDLTDDWALREREKHRRNYLNALWRLMQVASIRRDYAEGIRHAQAILDNDALREDVHRELMQLFVLGGQRAQALRQFEKCRELLRKELAIQPMRETLALYQKIANSAIGSDPEPTPPALAYGAPALLRQDDVQPGGLIDAARRHLASADAQLQMSLRFFRS